MSDAVILLAQELDALASAQSQAPRADAPHPLLAALDAIAQRAIGHRLFTVLAYDWHTRQARRRYSSHPDVYPAHGSKAMGDSAALRRMTEEGRPLLSPDADSVRQNFADADAIFRLGCASVLNIPVHDAGRLLGQVNLLHESGHFAPAHLRFATLLGVLAAPALLSAGPHGLARTAA